MNAGEPKVGDVLDARYRITGLLGTGGMGSVFRAEHVTIRRAVAIKVLHPDFADDPDHAKRFEREAFVTGRTDHPNCVTVSDFGPLPGGGYYLVMELVDGVLLADLLDEVEHLPARRVLHISRHVLRGLGHAHQHGIVHRDVKPANVILLEQDGDADFAKVLDFGIAKLVDAAAADAGNNQLTRVGTTVGTPTYVAPEQAVGGAIDARSDLYSVSIMMYEMLTGQPPFQDEDTVKVLAKHLSAPVPPMAELAPHIPVAPAVEELVRRGLAKDRKDRWASAAELVAAIDQLLASGEVDPRPAAHPVAHAPAGRAGPAAAGTPAPVAAGPLTQTSPGVRLAPRFTRRQLGLIGGSALVAALLIALAAGGGGDGDARPAGAAAPAGQLGAPATRPILVDPRRQKALADARALVDKKRSQEALALLEEELGAGLDNDAEGQLLAGHAHMLAGRPIEGLKSYWRVTELDLRRARDDERLRKNVSSLVTAKPPRSRRRSRGGGSSTAATIAAIELLAAIGDEPARALVAQAAVDPRNEVRHRARELAREKQFEGEIDRLTSYVLDLLHNRSCEERATAIPPLRELGDVRAIPALKRARGRRTGGILGLGSRSANGCMIPALDEAIAELEKKK